MSANYSLHTNHSDQPGNFPSQPHNQANGAVIDYTISQDFAAGYLAEQAENLQHFLRNDDNLLLRSSTDFWPSRFQTTTGNIALQDYQRQLMLLEQQNKKALLMARNEQDNLESKQEQSSRHVEQSRISRKRQRTSIEEEHSRKSDACTIQRKTKQHFTRSSDRSTKVPLPNIVSSKEKRAGDELSDSGASSQRSVNDTYSTTARNRESSKVGAEELSAI